MKTVPHEIIISINKSYRNFVISSCTDKGSRPYSKNRKMGRPYTKNCFNAAEIIFIASTHVEAAAAISRE